MPILRAVSKSKAHRVQAPRTRPAKAGTRLPAAAPRSSTSLYVTAIAVAVAAAVILIAVSVTGSRSGGGAPATLSGVDETAALLDGIPQSGTTLGSPSAPVRLVEYADLQCVYCGAWARDVFPTLVRRYVRTGKVQLEFRGLAFVGDHSLVGLRTALAAAQQNRLWNVTELLYRNQGAETSGWLSDSVVRGALVGISGVDASRVLGARDSAAVAAQVEHAAAQARAAGVTGTPTFQVARRGEPLRRLEVSALDVPSFAGPLDTLLGK
jgi:protein-disulfide isomerase